MRVQSVTDFDDLDFDDEGDRIPIYREVDALERNAYITQHVAGATTLQAVIRKSRKRGHVPSTSEVLLLQAHAFGCTGIDSGSNGYGADQSCAASNEDSASSYVQDSLQRVRAKSSLLSEQHQECVQTHTHASGAQRYKHSWHDRTLVKRMLCG